MDNDSVYINDGRFFAEPSAQVKAREEEIADTLAAVPLLKEVVDHLNDRLTFYSSISSVPSESLLHPDEFMHIINGNKAAFDNLIVERDFILGRIEAAVKR